MLDSTRKPSWIQLHQGELKILVLSGNFPLLLPLDALDEKMRLITIVWEDTTTLGTSGLAWIKV
jgi:hypothetical protein